MSDAIIKVQPGTIHASMTPEGEPELAREARVRVAESSTVLADVRQRIADDESTAVTASHMRTLGLDGMVRAIAEAGGS